MTPKLHTSNPNPRNPSPVPHRDVVIPNPCGFKPAVGTNPVHANALLKADSVYIHARLPSFLTPVKHVSMILVRNFELVITTGEDGKPNLAHLAENVGGFISTMDRVLGKDVVVISIFPGV